MKYYSEHGEDKWMDKHMHIPDYGIYVDVGAAHPTRMSNTAFLRHKGWWGIQIDGDPFWQTHWRKLGLDLINCVVTADGKGVKYLSNKTAHRLSTISEDGERTPSRKLNDILTEKGISHIDFMSLDVEGFEYEVFMSLEQKYWPDTLILEYDTLGKKDFRLIEELDKYPYYKCMQYSPNNVIYHHTNRTYNYHRSCWRYKKGKVKSSESHPCYFCGEMLEMKFVDKRECAVCGIMKCPSCHNCLCTITDVQYSTLIRIHEKYCCHLDEYKGVIELEEPYDHKLVENFLKTLFVCYSCEKENWNL